MRFIVRLVLLITIFILSFSSLSSAKESTKNTIEATATYNKNDTITVSGKVNDLEGLENVSINYDDTTINLSKEKWKSSKFTYDFKVKNPAKFRKHTIIFDGNFLVSDDWGTTEWTSSLYDMTVVNPAFIFDTESATKKKTKTAIRKKAKTYKSTYSAKSPYKTKPSDKVPLKAGSLKQGFLNDGVNTANFYRYLADLPDDLVLNKGLNANAQYGAVLLSHIGFLTHTPVKPKKVASNFYEKGYEATSSSNLAYGTSSLNEAVDLYMDDTDSSNIDRVGHRRWILNPMLKEVGFGYMDGFSSMKVFDESRDDIQEIKWDYISWPGKGYMPIEYFSSKTAWSVSLNPEVFRTPKSSNVFVQVKNKRTEHTWKLNRKMNKYTVSGNYLNVENSGYGSGPAIIFRPDLSKGLRAGDTYEIMISGITKLDGSSAPITYSVTFFEL
ncbi:CAP domain-containing protein [Peribacillus sp. NPDC097295]|uniref:CAP domain-containing protein n=1 Tax=Peribacillus sp. NPDC097295 TaxID=3364402 RepID=UPI0038256A8C